MSEIVTNEQHVASVRKRVVAVALGMLSGEIAFIEGAAELAALRHEAAVEDNDPDFTAFVAIESETDSLPIGPSRNRWSNEALARHQPEIDAATAWAKQVGTAACQSLVRRFHA